MLSHIRNSWRTRPVFFKWSASSKATRENAVFRKRFRRRLEGFVSRSGKGSVSPGSVMKSFACETSISSSNDGGGFAICPLVEDRISARTLLFSADDEESQMPRNEGRRKTLGSTVRVKIGDETRWSTELFSIQFRSPPAPPASSTARPEKQSTSFVSKASEDC